MCSDYRLIDISVPIFPGMPVFPGDPDVTFTPALQVSAGQPANVSVVCMGSQTGTHVDTPHHILNNALTTEDLPLERFYGPAQVIAIPEDVVAIEKSHLEAYDLGQCLRLLLKTRNSAFWQAQPAVFRTDFAALTAEAAQYLVDCGIQLVGTDALSIELYGSADLPAHHILLTHHVVILEGLNLFEVPPGTYILSAFPIRYQGLDGAPVRAVLVESQKPHG